MRCDEIVSGLVLSIKNTKLENKRNISFNIVPFRCYIIPPALMQLLEAILEIIFSQHLKLNLVLLSVVVVVVEFVITICFITSVLWNDLPFRRFLSSEIKVTGR